ncbi:MAG: hypothetical protein ACP5M4_16095, partial [Acidobacteriaceae bacterium]
SQEMAMKIGGEYLSQKVAYRNFEKFAEEAGLAKPLVRRRVVEMAEKILAGVAQMDILDPVAKGVAELIGNRAEEALVRFRA